MKTVTMDWETYQKELGNIQEKYNEAFDDGVRVTQKRLQPFLDSFRDALNGNTKVGILELKKLLEEAGKL